MKIVTEKKLANGKLLAEIWKEEVPRSKQIHILKIIVRGLGVSRQFAAKRMQGLPATDFFTLIIIRQFEKQNINLEKWETAIGKLKADYGEYEEYGLE